MSGPRIPSGSSGPTGSARPAGTENTGRSHAAESASGDKSGRSKTAGEVLPRKGSPDSPVKAGESRPVIPQENPGGNIHSPSLSSHKKIVSEKETAFSRPGLGAVNSLFGEVPPGTDTEAAPATVPAKELFNQTAALLGIPKDGLSTALLAFMRFFSLSPGAALMGNLRREVLESLKNSPSGAGDEKTSPEAEALAAVIAQDKGVSLSPEALEHYARFLVPPALPKKEDDSKKKDAPEEKDDSRDSEALPDAEGLSAAAGEEAAKEELLAFLNALPGKNGQRWAVYPLKLTVRGTELLIFIRLLKREPFSRGDGDFLIADVTGPKHGWRCCLKKTGGKYRADIRVYPGLPEPELSLLKKEAEKILGEGTGVFGEFCGFEEILLRNGEKAFSWADELCAENLPAVNKEV